MQQEVTILEIDWSEARGTVGSVGRPYLFGWLRAAYLRPGVISDGEVVVLVRTSESSGWDQYQGPVSLTQADTLISALAVLGIPGRAPRLHLVPDSSDTWFSSAVRVAVATDVRTFTIETQSSGFQGEEAEGLREIFRQILALSGYEGGESMLGGV